MKGTYHALENLSAEANATLVNDHFLFCYPEPILENSHCARHWPEARGIFFNAAKNFLVWINEEDHIRIISMQ